MASAFTTQADLCFELLSLLADGQARSQTSLAQRLNTTQSDVNALLDNARRWGADLEISGIEHLIRWKNPIVLLNASAIRSQISAEASLMLNELLVFSDIDSTNQYIMQAARRRDMHGTVCLAEVQTAGRGRRGNAWISPLGNLYLSLGWETAMNAATLGGLSLAIGVAIANALEELGLKVSLKWPNDVEYDGQKLCGILIESQIVESSSTIVVIGVGLNVTTAPQSIEGNVSTSLHKALAGPVDRSRVCALIISHLLMTVRDFERHGFEWFRSTWNDHHAMRDCDVVLSTSGSTVSGRALGVDRTGAIQLDVGGVVRSFNSGSLRLRTAE